jgi:hypothetical protein
MEKELSKENEGAHNRESNSPNPNRHNGERRKKPCEGYAYISMVGWMDRREKTRRKEDSCEL